MADELNSPSFGIEETLEMGVGNTKLIDDFFGSESSTGNPDKIEPIIKEISDDPKKKVKAEVPVEEKKEETKPSPQEFLKNFLGDEEEEEVKEEKADSPVPDSPSQEEEASAGTQFTALANDLFKLGVFVKAEDEEVTPITTAEEFLERFNFEKRRGAIEVVDNFLGQFGEDYRQAFDAIFVKGVDPQQYFGTYNNIVNFAELDLSKEENQEIVIKRALVDQGYESDEITKEIERLKNYGDLEAVSARHHKVLVKKEAAKLQEMEAAAEKEMQLKAQYKNLYIQNVQNILQEKVKAKEFDGIPINPKLAQELQDFLLVDKYKTQSGETLTDFDRLILELKRPENHAMKVKVALLLKTLEKDPTLSTIQKSGVTKQTNQLFSEVNRQLTKEKASNAQNKQNSWFT
ncbi:MAG TPA: hypothetical protein PLR64_03155 [Candidatus Dojkabacteria bacterium]|nr:hypothetical protein [Candidatus Dojkabacteria bacterium]